MASSELSSFNFPEELIIEILSRLPASFLVEFKVVCRAWNLLIKSPTFISKHLEQSKKKPKLSSVLVFSYKENENDYAMLTYSENSLDMALSPRFSFMDENDGVTILGVSDGLICIGWCKRNGCITMSTKFLICNHVTRKLHIIPDFVFPDDDPIFYFDTTFGFGFDPNSNYYKLVIVKPYLEQDQVAIYSMSTNSWRRINTKVPDDVRIWEFIAFATIGGVFYWEGYKHDDVVIWSFDMRDEVNRVIEGPRCYHGIGNYLKTQFFQLNEQLAMFLRTSERCYNVWMLNKEGTCWSEMFRIGPLPVIERPVAVQKSGEVTVAGCSKNGDVIVIDKTVKDDVKLWSYNLTGKEFKKLPFPHREYYVRQVFSYTGTLLPAKKTDQVQ